jgi:hypothetical protein
MNDSQTSYSQTKYSQVGQEQFVIDFLKNKKYGFFVELGASNGLLHSNTYLLENKYEWKGIY